MSHLDELETLHDLKEKGIISEEEFEKKKADLLNNQITPPHGDTSQLAYVLLAFFLGALGIHNFYAGRWKRGLVQLLLTLLTFGIGTLITAPWSIINIFTIHTNGKGEEMIPCKVAKYIFGIIGILYWLSIPIIMTVGGMYGYTTTMRRYQANEIVQTASMLATMAYAANGGTGARIELGHSGLNTNIGGIQLDPTGTFAEAPAEIEGIRVSAVTIKGADYDLCTEIRIIAPEKPRYPSAHSAAARVGYYIEKCSQ